MVILIASDNPGLLREIAQRLGEQTEHEVLMAATVEEMEALPAGRRALDLLVFSPEFSESGKEARARLRAVFVTLQTVLLDEGQTLEQQVDSLVQWIRERERNPGSNLVPAGEDPDGMAEKKESGGSGNDIPESSGKWNQESEPEVTPAGQRLPETGPEGTGPVPPTILGDYELQEQFRTTETTLLYRAVQRSVRRTVVLECLRPELAGDSAITRHFRQLVRARAMVSHPLIAAVYEAQESGEVLFYTRELVRGENLTTLAAESKQFSQSVLLRVLQAAGDGMVWLEEHAIPHEPMRPEHIHIGPNGTPRLLNLGAPEPSGGNPTAGSLAQLAAVCQRISEPRSAQTRELAHVLGLMKSPGPQGIHTWAALSREAGNSLQRLTEAHTSQLPESKDRVLARNRRRRIFLVWALAAVTVASLLGWALDYWRRSVRTKVRELSAMVRIPGGAFLFRDGRKVELPEFWIDQYEVTLAEYSSFLDSLPHGPLDRFDHPEQPAAKVSHKPPDWTEIVAAAKKGAKWQGHPLSLNGPVFNVDWWDAWAYANWKERRLPTEEEWEKAARGTDGRLWPWGNVANPVFANTGGDHAEQPGRGGGTDGHSWWCDVDGMPKDVSPDGVVGMAGNVAEWTATLVTDPDFPDVEVPVFRGGDFHQTSPVPLNAPPWLAKSALYAQPFLGFRTASSHGKP